MKLRARTEESRSTFQNVRSYEPLIFRDRNQQTTKQNSLHSSHVHPPPSRQLGLLPSTTMRPFRPKPRRSPGTSHEKIIVEVYREETPVPSAQHCRTLSKSAHRQIQQRYVLREGAPFVGLTCLLVLLRNLESKMSQRMRAFRR